MYQQAADPLTDIMFAECRGKSKQRKRLTVTQSIINQKCEASFVKIKDEQECLWKCEDWHSPTVAAKIKI